jgi:hypothetical protein
MDLPTESQTWRWRLAGLVRIERLPLSLGLYLLTLFIIHPAFLVTLGEINLWDEAAYINSGRTLLEGRLPSIADNPLVDGVYALTYLPFQDSPFWLPQSASLGRLLAYSLLWWSAYLIARQMARFASPWLLMGIFLVTLLPLELLLFPSDALFAALAGFSFWALLRYHDSQRLRNLWAASGFMGLAALARNDGLVLFPLLLALAALLTVPWKRAWQALLPCLLPFAVIIGGYLLVYGQATGSYSLATMRRTYDNFEAGHQVIFTGSGGFSPVVESKLEARRVFGTPEENGYSVFTAIRRNPGVYLHRLRVTLAALPRQVLEAYGLRFTVPLALLALRGVLVLLRRRQYRLLAAFLLWPAHLATGFVITLFRVGHLRFPYYVVFGLSAVGLGALLQAGLGARRERWLWLAALAAAAGAGLVWNKLAVYYGAAVLLSALLVIYWALGQLALTRPEDGRPAWTSLVPALVLLAAGMVIRGNFPSPVVPVWGDEARERAVLYLVEHLEPGAKVAAGSPGVVWAARMTYSGLASPDVPRDKDPQAFLDWMARQGVQAVYVDHSLYNTNPLIWSLIEARLGAGFERVFTADRGDIQVLLLDHHNVGENQDAGP